MGTEFNGYRVKIFKTKVPDSYFEKTLNEFLKSLGTFQMFTNTMDDMFIVTIVY